MTRADFFRGLAAAALVPFAPKVVEALKREEEDVARDPFEAVYTPWPDNLYLHYGNTPWPDNLYLHHGNTTASTLDTWTSNTTSW